MQGCCLNRLRAPPARLRLSPLRRGRANRQRQAPRFLHRSTQSGRKICEVSVAPHPVSVTRPAVPANLPTVSVTNNQETADDSQDANVPARHSFGAASALTEVPDVSITSSGAASHGHSKTKWIAVLAIAAGTGAALAFVHKGNTSSSSSSSGISIGSPSISVGHP